MCSIYHTIYLPLSLQLPTAVLQILKLIEEASAVWIILQALLDLLCCCCVNYCWRRIRMSEILDQVGYWYWPGIQIGNRHQPGEYIHVFEQGAYIHNSIQGYTLVEVHLLTGTAGVWYCIRTVQHKEIGVPYQYKLQGHRETCIILPPSPYYSTAIRRV